MLLASPTAVHGSDPPPTPATADPQPSRTATPLHDHQAASALRGNQRRQSSSQTGTRRHLRDTHSNSSTVVSCIDDETRFVVVMEGTETHQLLPALYESDPAAANERDQA